MWFIWWDPCGLICIILTWAVIGISNAVFVIALLPFLRWDAVTYGINTCVYEACIAMIYLSHLRTVFSDPGTIPQQLQADDSIELEAEDDGLHDESWTSEEEMEEEHIIKGMKRKVCSKCFIVKPQFTHHCSTCGRCIRRMDHHCPWVNNCVGQDNIKFFLLFLFYVFLGSSYTMCTVLYCAWLCYRADSRCDAENQPEWFFAGAITVFIMDLIFAIFVSCIGSDQYEVIEDGITGIDKLQGLHLDPAENSDFWTNLTCTMGGPFGLEWFIPVPGSLAVESRRRAEQRRTVGQGRSRQASSTKPPSLDAAVDHAVAREDDGETKELEEDEMWVKQEDAGGDGGEGRASVTAAAGVRRRKPPHAD